MLSSLGREIARVDADVPIESVTMNKQVDVTFKHVLLTSSVLIASSLMCAISLHDWFVWRARLRRQPKNS
jgi:hypothetical protein